MCLTCWLLSCIAYESCHPPLKEKEKNLASIRKGIFLPPCSETAGEVIRFEAGLIVVLEREKSGTSGGVGTSGLIGKVDGCKGCDGIEG